MQRLMLEKFETKIDVFHFFHDAAQKKGKSRQRAISR